MTARRPTVSSRRWTPFVALEAATLLSATGNGIALIALPWLVLELTGKASDAGAVAAVSALPRLATALLAGTVVDRVGRRRTSVAADTLSALSVAAIPVVGAFGDLTVTWLMVLGALGAFFDPAGVTARTTMIPAVAAHARIRLERANGIHESVNSTAYLVAPGVGGLLIAVVGAEATLWATAAAFVLAALLMAATPMPAGAPHVPRAERAGFWAETAEGLRFVRRSRALRTLAVVYLVVVALWLPVEGVVLPVLFQQQGAPTSLGLLLTAMSAGLVVGSLLYGLRGHRVPRRTAVVVALIGTALPIVGMALLPPLPWMIALGFVSGLLYGPMNPIVNVVMQERSPEAMRGRVLGVFTASAYAAGPLGLVLAGPLVDRLGVQGAFLTLSLALTAMAVGTLALRGLRDLDRRDPDLRDPAATSEQDGTRVGPDDGPVVGPGTSVGRPRRRAHPRALRLRGRRDGVRPARRAQPAVLDDGAGRSPSADRVGAPRADGRLRRRRVGPRHWRSRRRTDHDGTGSGQRPGRLRRGRDRTVPGAGGLERGPDGGSPSGDGLGRAARDAGPGCAVLTPGEGDVPRD
jgi:MFS family permease